MKEQVWRVNYHYNGFDMPIAIRATESELQAYMETELGQRYGYKAMTDKEVQAWKSCHLKIYLA